MQGDLYRIVFKGEIVPGHEISKVKDNFSRLFKIEEPVLEKLFSGRSLVIKNDIDYETAERWRNALESTGVLCIVETKEKAGPEDHGDPDALSRSVQQGETVSRNKGNREDNKEQLRKFAESCLSRFDAGYEKALKETKFDRASNRMLLRMFLLVLIMACIWFFTPLQWYVVVPAVVVGIVVLFGLSEKKEKAFLHILFRESIHDKKENMPFVLACFRYWLTTIPPRDYHTILIRSKWEDVRPRYRKYSEQMNIHAGLIEALALRKKRDVAVEPSSESARVAENEDSDVQSLEVASRGAAEYETSEPVRTISDERKQELACEVRLLVVEILDIDPALVTDDASIRSDLGATEMDLLKIVVDLEDKFQVQLTECQRGGIVTVGNIIDCLIDQCRMGETDEARLSHAESNKEASRHGHSPSKKTDRKSSLKPDIVGLLFGGTVGFAMGKTMGTLIGLDDNAACGIGLVVGFIVWQIVKKVMQKPRL